MPNLKTQSQLEADLAKFEAQEKALRILGWVQVDGKWYHPHSDLEYTFEQATIRVGIQ